MSILLSALMVISCFTLLFPSLVEVLERDGLLPVSEAAASNAEKTALKNAIERAITLDGIDSLLENTGYSTSGGGAKNDKMVSYLSELEESGIDSEIKRVIEKIDKLQNSIYRMEIILQNVENISGVDNLEYKVLKLKYYENRTFTLQQIADRLNYSLDRIKQVSADVEKKLKSNYYTKNTL